MDETSLSLLSRLREPDASDAWHRLNDLYSPMLKVWMWRYDVQDSDADDLAQEVMLAVSKDVATFQHNGRAGAFRNWLKLILVHRLRDHWRASGRRPDAMGGSDVMQRLSQLEDQKSSLSQLWNREHDRHVVKRLLELAEPRFASTTWNAFRRVVFDRVPPDQVAEELGMTLNAVFIAKSRVIRRLRLEAEGLIECSSFFS